MFLGTFAYAKAPLIKSFEGRIHNYTSFANEELEVQLILDCSYTSGFVWPESKSCGYQRFYVPVQSDGTFIVPDMPWQKRNSLKNYNFTLSISPRTHKSQFLSFNWLQGNEIKKYTELSEISLYELPEIKINAITPTGDDYASWRGTVADRKEPCVEIIFNLQAIGFDRVPGTMPSTDRRVAGVLPAVHFGLKGNHGPDIKVKGQIDYWSAKPSCDFNPVFKAEGTNAFTGTLQEVHNYFNNSSYKVD